MWQLIEGKSPLFDEELLQLAFGPVRAKKYFDCHVKGVKFLTTKWIDKLCTQNSGVFVLGVNENSFFFAKLLSKVQLLHTNHKEVMMLKFHWYDMNPNKAGSLTQDKYLLFVNTNTRWFEDVH